MIKLAIAGSGNLAFKLYSALIELEEIAVVGVFGRNPKTLADFDQTLTTTDPLALPAADLTLIAVSDDAISEVAAQLHEKHGLLAHTSGARSITAIASAKRGVCYPLQTFSRTREVDFSQVPFCLEAETDKDYDLLVQFSGLLSNKIKRMRSDDRKYLHLAAVYVNNFVNQMYQTAAEILEKRDLEFELLHPLIAETADKVKGFLPAEVQTGPAKRNDSGVIEAHLQMQSPELQEMYLLITAAIQKSQQR